jgi:hypothetical protein
MVTMQSDPQVLKCAALEEDLNDKVIMFFNWLRETASVVMFGNDPESPVQVGYAGNGPQLLVSVPPVLRAAIQPQAFVYNAKRRGSDATVNITLVHQD